LLALLVVGTLSRDKIFDATLPLKTITVQCFDNQSDDPDSEYFVDGLADEIRVALGRVEGIRVITRTSSEGYCDRGLTMKEIGTELGAGAVLEGRVRRASDQIRVTVDLGNTSNGQSLLAETYDGSLADIFEVQDRIARDVAKKLSVTLSPGATLVVAPTEDLDAYQLYLRAHFQLRRRGAEPMRRAVDLFQEAIARDPSFGRAYQGLAEVFALIPSYTGAESAAFMEMSLAALEQAETLGGTDSHAHAIRAFIHFHGRDWEAAHAAFKLAAAGEPDNSDMLQWHSQFLTGLGYVDQGSSQAERSVEEDPLSPVAHQRLAVAKLWSGDLEAADEEFRISTEELGLEPLANARSLVPLMFRRGQFGDVETHAFAMLSAIGDETNWIAPWVAFMAGEGPSEPALRRLKAAYEAQRLDSRIYVGALYFLDDADALYQAIDQITAQGQTLDHEVWFVEEGHLLQNDPRFPDLLDRWKILDYWEKHGWPAGCQRVGELIQCGSLASPESVSLSDPA
jgi:TolB-like protein/Tfp pilus assembly protein PilF